MKRFLNSFKYAFEGIITTIKEERNIKIHILAVVVVIIMGVIYKISQVEWIICLILFGLVISSETINTSIENAVDLITKEENELAKKKLKDAAAGAVLVNAIISAIIAGIIWIPKNILIKRRIKNGDINRLYRICMRTNTWSRRNKIQENVWRIYGVCK